MTTLFASLPKQLVFTAFISLFLPSAAMAEDSVAHCPKARFRFCLNCVQDIEWAVKKNGVCTARFWPDGGILYSTPVVQRPQHGKITGTQYRFEVRYVPNKGFVGSDHFTIRINWENNGSKIYTDLRVHMIVQ